MVKNIGFQQPLHVTQLFDVGVISTIIPTGTRTDGIGAREITHALVDEQFDGFERHKVVNLSSFVMTTEYEATLDLPCAYPPEKLVNSLGEFLSNQGKQQLRIAETEKYPHVTFFFSGGREEPFIGENRILKNSPKVATYDLKPEMSAYELKDALIPELQKGAVDFVGTDTYFGKYYEAENKSSSKTTIIPVDTNNSKNVDTTG